MAKPSSDRTVELPPDNAARIAIFDAVHSPLGHRPDGLQLGELMDEVLVRLRVLVPRELHVQGEGAYVRAKADACLASGILESRQPSGLLILGPNVPMIRYPDGAVRAYVPGLEPARERLDCDENRLRQRSFDVRHVVKSPAQNTRSDRYKALVASMEEHGFLDQLPMVVSRSGEVIDGRAREAVAAQLGIQLKKQHKSVLKRRDTPLQNALLVLELNVDRLRDEDHHAVHDSVAKLTERPWAETLSDLQATRLWRSVEPREYNAKFEVKLLPFSQQTEARVQITVDGERVGLRSVIQQAGIPNYNYTHLLPFVPVEEACTQLSGKKAMFVRIGDAIDGIEAMQEDRRVKKLKIDSAWDQIRSWLLSLRTPSGPQRQLEV